LRHFADTLTQCIRSDGAVPFAADVHQFNVWTAMFADQALAFADGDRYEIARIAAAPSIV